jgi:dUTP pyrophosphatase
MGGLLSSFWQEAQSPEITIIARNQELMADQFLYFAKTRPGAIVPFKRPEDSGYDVYSCFTEESILLEPGDIKLVPTGIATAFPQDYVLFIKERSSTGSIGLATRMGVIDSGFRGEIMIGLNNTSKVPILITKEVTQVVREEGLIKFPYTKAIAQAVLCVIPRLEVEELDYDELLKIRSERGVSFLGASGK